MSSSNIEELGKLFNEQMKHVNQANKGVTVELGNISGNGSLVVGSLNNAIPKGEYMVALRLTIGQLLLETTEMELTTNNEINPSSMENHTHKIDKHKHEVTLPEQLRALRAGDRVLVAWIGTEPVVVDIVVSS